MQRWIITIGLLGGLAGLLGWSARYWWPEPELSVAAHPWPGYEFLYLTNSEEPLVDDGIFLQRTDNAGVSMDMLRRGVVDAAALTLDEAMQLCHQGIGVSVVTVLDLSSGADQVIARQPFVRGQSLAGMTVAYEASSLGELMLHSLLDFFATPLEQIKIRHLAPNEQLGPWLRGEIDIAISYEPNSGELLNEGGVTIFDSSDIPGRVMDVLVVRNDRLEERTGRLQRLVDAHFHGLDLYERDPLHMRHQLARLAGYDLHPLLQGMKLPGRFANKQLLIESSPVIHQALAFYGQALRLRCEPPATLTLDGRFL